MAPQTPKSSGTLAEPDINTPLFSPNVDFFSREEAVEILACLTGKNERRRHKHHINGPDVPLAIYEGRRIPTRCGRMIHLEAIPGRGGKVYREGTPECPACRFFALAGTCRKPDAA